MNKLRFPFSVQLCPAVPPSSDRIHLVSGSVTSAKDICRLQLHESQDKFARLTTLWQVIFTPHPHSVNCPEILIHLSVSIHITHK